jgi:tetratricopeptide (TPR) repeat protein
LLQLGTNGSRSIRSFMVRNTNNHLRAEADRLTYKLAALIESGADDSEEVEIVREQLHSIWMQLSPNEQKSLQRFSAELEMIFGGEVARPSSSRKSHSAPTQMELFAEIKKSMSQEKWDKVLDLIREHPATFPSDMTAFLRATAYLSMGRYDNAIAFSSYALKTLPFSPPHLILLLEALASAGYTDELNAKLERIEREPKVPPVVSLTIANILSQLGRRSENQTQVLSLYKKCLFWIERGLASPRDIATRIVGIRASALGIKSDAYQRLDMGNESLQALEEAVSLSPNDPVLRVMRALRFADIDAKKAAADCDLAIKLGSIEFFPYVYLADQAFKVSDFVTALRLCKAALRLPGEIPSSLRAALLQMQGIAQFETGGSPSSAEMLLDRAFELNPNDPSVRKNIAMMRQRANRYAWETDEQQLVGKARTSSEDQLSNRISSLMSTEMGSLNLVTAT